MEAEKSKPELYSLLSEGTELSLIIAGMGGGTGTGAAPVIASISKELGIPTVGIVTLPLSLEGRRRMMQALDGIEEMAIFTKVGTRRSRVSNTTCSTSWN